mgnify:CR=1 FL=1
MTNPNTNPDQGERDNASGLLVGWLRDKSKSFFTKNELADYIIETEYEQNFDSPTGLGAFLDASEVRVLRELIEQKQARYQQGDDSQQGWGRRERDESRGSARTGFPPEEIRRLVESLLERSGETIYSGAFFVKLSRSNGGTSDAFISTMVGDNVSFIVPVDTSRLGVKVHSLDELASMGAQWSAAEQKVVFG